jgi:hypothetical protein
MKEKDIDTVLQQVKDELIKANVKHSSIFNSNHEGYAVLKEEVDEMWDDIKADLSNHSCLEAIQVAAMAVKYIICARDRSVLR